MEGAAPRAHGRAVHCTVQAGSAAALLFWRSLHRPTGGARGVPVAPWTRSGRPEFGSLRGGTTGPDERRARRSRGRVSARPSVRVTRRPRYAAVGDRGRRGRRPRPAEPDVAPHRTRRHNRSKKGSKWSRRCDTQAWTHQGAKLAARVHGCLTAPSTTDWIDERSHASYEPPVALRLLRPDRSGALRSGGCVIEYRRE